MDRALGPQLPAKLTDLKIKYVTFGPKLEFLGILVLYHFKNFNFNHNKYNFKTK